METIVQLDNGTILRKVECFIDDSGTIVEPEGFNNCYTYSLGWSVVEKGLDVYINPGFTENTGMIEYRSKMTLIQSVMSDCKKLGIKCSYIPIEGKANKIRKRLNQVQSKTIIKAFWAPPDYGDIFGQYGYYHFVRREQGIWMEKIGLNGPVWADDVEPKEERVTFHKLNPIAYFIIE